MANRNPTLGSFLKATSDAPMLHPWSLLPKKSASDPKYQYALRTATIIPTVQLLSPVLHAMELYFGSESHLTASNDCFRIVFVGNKNGLPNCYVEMRLNEKQNIVVMCDADKNVRASIVEEDGTLGPCGQYVSMTLAYGYPCMTAFYLALMPQILDVDAKQGNGKVMAAGKEMAQLCDEADSWSQADDIPELFRESSYYLDAVRDIVLNLDPNMGDNQAPNEIDPNSLTNEHISGLCMAESVSDSWEPRIIKSVGAAPRYSGGILTVAEAKQQFGSYSADRHWSVQERRLIPQLADDMPVMPEVLRIAKRITETQSDVNPVVNLMWRGVTSYGKSTGIKQLAAILDMPLLILTCHPNMEAQDFISQMVPDSKTEDILLDMNSVHTTRSIVAATDQPRHPMLEKAVSNVLSLNEQEQKRILEGTDFITMALMDTDAAAQALLGPGEPAIAVEELLWLHGQTVQEILTKPLRDKLAELEAITPEAKEKKEKNFLEFVHVCSPYLKAMANGYIVEIQEASRIRDSGVMVAINEFDRPNAVIPLMNGYTATRHPKAISVITDNVGYASCRPVDPSVLRRQSLIIDSYELPKELLLDRVKRNTGVSDSAFLERAYSLWEKVQSYCRQNAITDGSVSPMELERFVQAVKYDGMDSIPYNLDDCIISKATSDPDSQREIRTVCQTLSS